MKDDEMTSHIVQAAVHRQPPNPSPESVVAKILADCSPPKGVNRTAHQITTALREAGWRILR